MFFTTFSFPFKFFKIIFRAYRLFSLNCLPPFQLPNPQFRCLHFRVTCDAVRPVLIDSGYIQTIQLVL
jgi:hypothetical protein